MPESKSYIQLEVASCDIIKAGQLGDNTRIRISINVQPLNMKDEEMLDRLFPNSQKQIDALLARETLIGAICEDKLL